MAVGQSAKKICLHRQYERLKWPGRRLAGQGSPAPRSRRPETADIPRGNGIFLLEAFRGKNFRRLFLRVAGIYGPERGHWFKQFLKNEARMEGNGSRFLNMIHRDDVVGCIIAALKSGRSGEIYNAVDDEPVSQKNFFEWLGAAPGSLSAAVCPRKNAGEALQSAETTKQTRFQPKIKNGTWVPVQASEFPKRLHRGDFAAGPRGRIARGTGRTVDVLDIAFAQ